MEAWPISTSNTTEPTEPPSKPVLRKVRIRSRLVSVNPCACTLCSSAHKPARDSSTAAILWIFNFILLIGLKYHLAQSPVPLGDRAFEYARDLLGRHRS